MTYYSIPPLVSALLFAILGLVVYRHNPSVSANRGYLYWCISTACWQATWTVLFNVSDQTLIDPIIRLGYSFIIFIPIAYYHFVIAFLKLEKERKIVSLSYAIGVLFLILLWTGRSFIDGHYHFPWGYYPRAGRPMHPVYLVFLTLLACRGQLLTFRQMHSTAPGIRRRQLKYLLIAGLAYIPASVDFLTNYGVSLYPFGVIPILISLAVVAYSILRHRLLEFDLVMRWGLAYAILISVVAGAVVPMVWVSDRISARSTHVSSGLTTVILVSALVFLVDPLKKQINRFVDLFIFKSLDFRPILSRLEEMINQQMDPASLSSALVERLHEIWPVDHIGLALWDNSLACFKLTPEEQFRDRPITHLRMEISRPDFLVRTLSTERRLFRYGIVIEEEVTALGNRASPGERTTFWKIRRTMRWLGASACVPFMKESELVGFLILGQKKDQRVYTEEDKKLLSHVAGIISYSLDRFYFSQAA